MQRIVICQRGHIPCDFDTSTLDFVCGKREAVVICNSSSIQRKENYRFLPIGRRNEIDLSEIIDALEPAGQVRIVLRNYLEPGNIVITDYSGNAYLSYVILGDTHHIAGSLSYCFFWVKQLKPDVVSSLANPIHLGIFKPVASRLTTYPYQVYMSRHTIKPLGVCDKREFSIALCGTLDSYHPSRTRLVRQLVRSARYLDSIHIFARQISGKAYLSELRRAYGCVIPSINQQVSPQIYYSLQVRTIPIVDCKAQLSSSQSLRQLASVCLSCKDFESLVQTASWIESGIYQDLSKKIELMTAMWDKRVGIYSSEAEFYIRMNDRYSGGMEKPQWEAEVKYEGPRCTTEQEALSTMSRLDNDSEADRMYERMGQWTGSPYKAYAVEARNEASWIANTPDGVD